MAHLNQMTMLLINQKTGVLAMRKRIGQLTLRFAKGPGRQSGVWAACAAALAGLPFLALLAPGCADVLTCSPTWDRIFFVPRLLFMPAVLATMLLLGSWWAQHRHARVDRAFFTGLDARSDQPDRPPGEFDTSLLEKDLAKRTLRGTGQGALLGAGLLAPLLFTTVALRRCNPWTMSGSGLPTCSDPAGWTDMVLAFEVWGTLITGLVWGIVLLTRSSSIHAQVLPKRPRRFLARLSRS